MTANSASTAPVCVVTGSSGTTGIGAATILRFAREGWRVVVNYAHSAGRAGDVAAECERVGAAGVMLQQADVAKDDDCRRLAAAVGERWGRVDALVNNAGITRFVDMRDLDGLSGQDFMDIYAVNVIGTYQMTRAMKPWLERAGQASVTNISSGAGVRGTGSCMAYAASKGALNTMTISLARVLGPRVRVNAILPGMVDSDWMLGGMGPEAYEGFRQKYAAASALGTTLKPSDVADLAWWLASSAGATKMSGQLLNLDAGAGAGRA